MHIDYAGRNPLTTRIHYRCAVGRKVGAYSDDLAAREKHIGVIQTFAAACKDGSSRKQRGLAAQAFVATFEWGGAIAVGVPITALQ